MPHISDFKNKHLGQTAYIVGRGPSILSLGATDIGNGFVIAINQAIAQIDKLNISNTVYSMYSYGCEIYPKEEKQKIHKCEREISLPVNAPILIDDTPGEGNNCLLDYPKRYSYLAQADLGISNILASGATSIFIAKYLGATEIKMLCFDAYTDMDLRAINPDNTLQKTDAAYIGQRRQIEWAIEQTKIPVSFIKPVHNVEIASEDNGVLIGTPIHGSNTVINYTKSLAYTFAGFYKGNIPIEVLPISDSCFIDAARNYIFTMFLESKFKKLFFIDADMGWEFRDFLEMYLLDVDFVGALYPKRNRWDEYTGSIAEPRAEKNGLIKAASVPTGFMCLTKKACKQIVRQYPEYYRREGRSIYDVFRMERENYELIGEDYSFCRKYVKTGGEMWIYPNCNLSHYGGKQFEGNFGEHIGKPGLDHLFDVAGSDKGNLGHRYGRFYEDKLGRFNGNRLKLLEIGLSIRSNGTQSLDVWKKWFKNVDIVGLDIVGLKQYEKDRVTILKGAQGNVEDLKQLDAQGTFDIIIDDGSHESPDQIVSFDYLYPKLNKGGLYFVEDLAAKRNDAFIEHVEKYANKGKVEFYKSLSPEARIMCVEAV